MNKVISISILFLLVITLLPTVSSGQNSPVIQGESILEFPNELEPHNINWTIIDDNPRVYNISIIEDIRNNTTSILSSGSWHNQTTSNLSEEFEVSVNVILEVGNYIFILFVRDFDDNTAQFSTEVKVGDVNDIDFLPGPGLPISIYWVLMGLVLITGVARNKRKVEF